MNSLCWIVPVILVARRGLAHLADQFDGGEQPKEDIGTMFKVDSDHGDVPEILPLPQLLTAGSPGILEDVHIDKLNGFISYDALQAERVEESNNMTAQEEISDGILKRRKRSEFKEHISGRMSDPSFLYGGVDYKLFKDPRIRRIQEKIALEKLKGKGRYEKVDIDKIIRQSKFQFKEDPNDTNTNQEEKINHEKNVIGSGLLQFKPSTLSTEFEEIDSVDEGQSGPDFLAVKSEDQKKISSLENAENEIVHDEGQIHANHSSESFQKVKTHEHVENTVDDEEEPKDDIIDTRNTSIDVIKNNKQLEENEMKQFLNGLLLKISDFEDYVVSGIGDFKDSLKSMFKRMSSAEAANNLTVVDGVRVIDQNSTRHKNSDYDVPDPKFYMKNNAQPGFINHQSALDTKPNNMNAKKSARGEAASVEDTITKELLDFDGLEKHEDFQEDKFTAKVTPFEVINENVPSTPEKIDEYELKNNILSSKTNNEGPYKVLLNQSLIPQEDVSSANNALVIKENTNYLVQNPISDDKLKSIKSNFQKKRISIDRDEVMEPRIDLDDIKGMETSALSQGLDNLDNNNQDQTEDDRNDLKIRQINAVYSNNRQEYENIDDKKAKSNIIKLLGKANRFQNYREHNHESDLKGMKEPISDNEKAERLKNNSKQFDQFDNNLKKYKELIHGKDKNQEHEKNLSEINNGPKFYSDKRNERVINQVRSINPISDDEQIVAHYDDIERRQRLDRIRDMLSLKNRLSRNDNQEERTVGIADASTIHRAEQIDRISDISRRPDKKK